MTARLDPEAMRRAAEARQTPKLHRVRLKPSAWAREFDFAPWTEGMACASYDTSDGRRTNVHLDDGRYATGVPMTAVEAI